MKKTYRSILSIGLLSALIVSLVFMSTGCGFLGKSPTARIEQDPQGTLSVDQTVTFNGKNSSEPGDPEGEIDSYDWVFEGDFDRATDQDEPIQTGSYTSSGTYDVTLTVTDETGSDSTTIEVEVN